MDFRSTEIDRLTGLAQATIRTNPLRGATKLSQMRRRTLADSSFGHEVVVHTTSDILYSHLRKTTVGIDLAALASVMLPCRSLLPGVEGFLAADVGFGQSCSLYG